MISRNSLLFSQTSKIREQRNRFNSDVRNLLEQRKTSDRFAIAGQLPDIGAGGQRGRHSLGKEDLDSVAQQQQDYEDFERKMERRFR